MESQGMGGLRERFRTLKAFVETIPAEKLDMQMPFKDASGCGCIMAHSPYSDDSPLNVVFDHGTPINSRDRTWLLNSNAKDWPYPLELSTGQPAKDEFLRRLAELENKYCGAES